MIKLLHLSVLCTSEEAAERVSTFFRKMEVKIDTLSWFLTGFTCKPRVDKSPAGEWFCEVNPVRDGGHVLASGMNRDRLDGVKDFEVRIALLKKLRHAPPFLAASVGYEPASLENIRHTSREALVLDSGVWKKAGAPPQYKNFADGTVWIPLTFHGMPISL